MAGRIPRAESWDGFPVLDGTGSNESTDLRIPTVFDRILQRSDTRAPGSYRRPRGPARYTRGIGCSCEHRDRLNLGLRECRKPHGVGVSLEHSERQVASSDKEAAK